MYLKLPYLGNTSEKFSKKNSEEVNQVFGSARLATILYTDRPLSGTYKDAFLIQEKVTFSINLVVITTWEKYLKDFT